VGHSLYDKIYKGNTPYLVYQDITHLASEVWPLRKLCSKDKITLLFVGELSKAKGVDLLVEAVEGLANKGFEFRLVVVGLGPEAERLKKRCNNRVQIELKGWVSHGKDLDALFMEADALVLPSMTEGVPRVVIEAMVRATPVIASKVGDIPRILGDGMRGWLVSPGDLDDLMMGIEKFICDNNDRIERVMRATEYVKKYDKGYWAQVIRSQFEKIDPALVCSIPAGIINNRPVRQ
jgi:glycosyltransferase involved in cell wall biosynthesis